MDILAFLFTFPWMVVWSLLEWLFPELTRRKCPTCGGKAFIPLETEKLFRLCTCKGMDEDCPYCFGAQFIRVETEHFHDRCPDCRDGTWPRAWAYHVNATVGVDNRYHGDVFDHIYSHR